MTTQSPPSAPADPTAPEDLTAHAAPMSAASPATAADPAAPGARGGEVLMQSGKIALLLRLLCAFPVMLSWRDGGAPAVEVILVLVTTVASGVLILCWARVVPFVLRHPAVLIIDILAAFALLGHQGVDSAFLAYLFSSALLIGMLYDCPGRELLTALLLAGLLGTAALSQRITGITGASVSSLIGSAVVIIVVVGIGSSLRRLQSQVDATVEVARETARDAALGEERSRLARELHDSLVKTLVGIGLQARALGMTQPAALSTATSIGSAAESAVAQSRVILTNLRSEHTPPLCASLRMAAQEIGALHGVLFELDCGDDSPGAAPEPELDDERRYNIRKIAEEAMTNAAKYAQASRITVRLQVRAGTVELRVEDDGQGFRPRAQARQTSGHFGLTGMRERAAQIGGVLHIRSKRGHGTSVVLRAPIQEEC